MRLPNIVPLRPTQEHASPARRTRVRPAVNGASSAARDGERAGHIAPAGCCAQICTPLGCHCVAEAPFC